MKLIAETLNGAPYAFNFEDIGEMYTSNNVFYVNGIPLVLSTVKSVDAETMHDALNEIVERCTNEGTTPDYKKAVRTLFKCGRLALDIITNYKGE